MDFISWILVLLAVQFRVEQGLRIATATWLFVVQYGRWKRNRGEVLKGSLTVTDVSKPLLSVGRMIEAGSEIVLNKVRPHIKFESGRSTRIFLRNGECISYRFGSALLPGREQTCKSQWGRRNTDQYCFSTVCGKEETNQYCFRFSTVCSIWSRKVVASRRQPRRRRRNLDPWNSRRRSGSRIA